MSSHFPTAEKLTWPFKYAFSHMGVLASCGQPLSTENCFTCTFHMLPYKLPVWAGPRVDFGQPAFKFWLTACFQIVPNSLSSIYQIMFSKHTKSVLKKNSFKCACRAQPGFCCDMNKLKEFQLLSMVGMLLNSYLHITLQARLLFGLPLLTVY